MKASQPLPRLLRACLLMTMLLIKTLYVPLTRVTIITLRPIIIAVILQCESSTQPTLLFLNASDFLVDYMYFNQKNETGHEIQNSRGRNQVDKILNTLDKYFVRMGPHYDFVGHHLVKVIAEQTVVLQEKREKLYLIVRVISILLSYCPMPIFAFL